MIPNVYIFYVDCSFLCRANAVFFTTDDVKAKSVIGIILCVKSFVFIFPRNMWINKHRKIITLFSNHLSSTVRINVKGV